MAFDSETASRMLFRPLGRSGLSVSVIGFGSAQLRQVTEQQGIEALRTAFKLGVNLVHTAPDYEGADVLITEAAAASRREVIVASQGYGSMDEFRYHYENAHLRFGKRGFRPFKPGCLPLFGIACVDDREKLGENVWDARGMVEFLDGEKRAGRLCATFCTTHGSPEYVRRLIESGAFDAVMLAYNPLGYHLLSQVPSVPGGGERLREAPILFPLAASRRVGLMLMKPLAGGLLSPAKAFPPHDPAALSSSSLTSGIVFRWMLARHPEISCVIPGTASPVEARENALAGHAPLVLAQSELDAVEAAVSKLQANVCSRCGECEPLCRHGLKVSWLFRASLIENARAMTFETPATLRYFDLHPAQPKAMCASCPDTTCRCPNGIDIKARLCQAHAMMWNLHQHGQVGCSSTIYSTDSYAATLVGWDLDTEEREDHVPCCRLSIENTGSACWQLGPGHPRVSFEVSHEGAPLQSLIPRRNVARGHSCQITVGLLSTPTPFDLSLKVTGTDDTVWLHKPIGRVPELRELQGDSLPLAQYPSEAESRGATPLLLSSLIKTSPASDMAAPRPRYGAAFTCHHAPAEVLCGTRFGLWLRIGNTGDFTWDNQASGGRLINVLVRADESIVGHVPLPHPVPPGTAVDLHIVGLAPNDPGRRILSVQLVHEGVCYFDQQGVPPLEIPIALLDGPVPESVRLYEILLPRNSWFYQPSRGIARASDGRAFPLALSRAEGCYVWDADGRRFIDFTSGWGCALLGHNHEAIRRAVHANLDSGGTLPLPHRLEAEITEMLCDYIPCAESVAFGKNGSDVCTLAVRLARVVTGRTTILTCGYHGWQDWAIESRGMACSGVPERARPLTYRFPFNDINAFRALLAEHRKDIAAVMLEPSGPSGETPAGLGEETDPAFLRAVADETRTTGALLIFDEIITGFRYPGGGLQQALAITPDLACFGKALANGFPLSALVGRRDVFSAMSRVFYGPTFKGETYALAASKAALEIYRKEPVAEQVCAQGRRIKEAIARLCAEHGIASRLVGPDFRFGLHFEETDLDRRACMGTLWLQEIMKGGLLPYYRFMLPNLAHDDETFETSVQAIAAALARIAEARSDLHAAIEIPLIHN